MLLRYFYRVKARNIFTDHQPLTFDGQDWQENYSAGALPRQHIHVLENKNSADIATIHTEESLTYSTGFADKPANYFRM